MRRLATILLLCVAAGTGCTRSDARIANLSPSVSAQRTMLEQAKRVNGINAQIGGQPVEYITDGSRLDPIRRQIAPRLENDLRMHCNGSGQIDGRAYLVLEESEVALIARVIRAKGETPAGAYTPLCGLTYTVDRRTGRVLDARSDSY